MSDYAVMPLTDYGNICDSIRNKTAIKEDIKSGEIPDKIEKVYEAGQKSEYDRFWDAYQNYGERNSCEGTFMGYGWNEVTLKPKYDIKPSTAYMMFAYCGYTGDLDEVFKNRNVNLDFSKCANMGYAFFNTQISTLGTVDCSGVTGTTSMDSVFNSTKIVTIKNFIPPLIAMKATCWQSGLENIGVGGDIVADLNVSRCTKLTHDSLMGIINALKDYGSVTIECNIEGGPFDSQVTEYGTKYEIDSVSDYGNGAGGITLKTVITNGNDYSGTSVPIMSGFDSAKYSDATHVVFHNMTSLTLYFSEDTTTQTLTLGTTNLAKLTDEEKAIATAKGWTLA